MMEEHRKRVLVTALGTMNCTTIVGELAKKGYYIIGTDINPAKCIYTSTEVDEYYQFPKATEDREGYYKFVRQFCLDHHVDIYLCVVDEEVETMAIHRNELSNIGVDLCVANTEVVTTCHRKDLFALWAEQNIPEYCIRRYTDYHNIVDDDFPLFIKPIEGRASIGCRTIYNRDELNLIRDKWSKYIVQDFFSGDIIAADIVRCRTTGLTQICQRKELLRNSNGCGVAVEIVNNEKVANACKIIAERLDLNGIVNAEFFVKDDDARIIEVNPRIPAGVAYSCMAGLNLVELAVEIAQGTNICTPSPIRIGACFAKRYETFEIKK